MILLVSWSWGGCGVERGRKKLQVWLYRLGCWKAPTHGRDPTTARHECFWLLGFPPGPIRSSLGNLDTADSSTVSMLMPGLVRTPVQRRRRSSRTPSLKSSTTTSLPEAGLQKRATLPAGKGVSLNVYNQMPDTSGTTWGWLSCVCKHSRR